MPARGPRAKAPLSLQVARASWQFVGITAVVFGITWSIGKRDPTVRSIAEIVIAVMLAISIAFGIFGLVSFSREEDEESELRPPLLKNSLAGFAAVLVMVGIAVPLFLTIRDAEHRKKIAAITPVPTATPVAATDTPRVVTSGGAIAAGSPAGAPGTEPIAVDEGRSFAKSYVTLIQRNLFDEAYKYLPADVRGRVSTKKHQDLWMTAAGVDREEIVIADAKETEGGKAVEVKVQIPGKSEPQVIVVQKAGEKMWATPRQFVQN